MKRIGEHAVVIGASMGGLLATRALADFYGRVTVLERDVFPVADIPRKGVPQGKHAHGKCRVRARPKYASSIGISASCTWRLGTTRCWRTRF